MKYEFNQESGDYTAFEYWENGGEVFEFRATGEGKSACLGIFRANDELIGQIEVSEGFHPSIDSAWQGVGLGKRMYMHFLQWQFLQGHSEVWSDAQVCVASQRTWHSLKNLGYIGEFHEIVEDGFQSLEPFAKVKTQLVAPSEDFLPWDNENQEVAA
jgi:hypothetical protein